MGRLVPSDSTNPVAVWSGYLGIHLLCFGAIWTGVSWTAVAICAVSFFARNFGLMAGYHRYFSHRAFSTSRGGGFFFALLGTLCIQRGPLWWASHHRHHHRYSDTELDYFSPMQTNFFYAHSGWFLDPRNVNTDYTRVSDFAAHREIVWLDKWSTIPMLIFGVALWAAWGWTGLVYGMGISTVLIWHGVHGVGSIGHKIGGTRRFATTDNSRNQWFLGTFMMGEGWHNNHHFYPSSARLGFFWWEIDLAWYGLKLMSWLGLVWDLRVPPRHLLARKSADEQAQVQRLEVWAQRLRLAWRAHIVQALPDGEEREVYRHLLDDALDVFERDCIDALLHDPPRLARAAETLREAVAAHALAPELEAILDEAIDASPVAHFLRSERAAMRSRVSRPSLILS
jgi:stearoyl-CoA desaturase (Delta-9 desaturase)